MTSLSSRSRSRIKSCAAGIEPPRAILLRRRSPDCSRIECRQNPEAVAVSFEGEALTYAELNAKANRLAHHLIRHGAQRGVHRRTVPRTGRSICLSRLLAIQKSGAAYLPLDPGLSSRAPEPTCCNDSGASLLLAGGDAADWN